MFQTICTSDSEFLSQLSRIKLNELSLSRAGIFESLFAEIYSTSFSHKEPVVVFLSQLGLSQMSELLTLTSFEESRKSLSWSLVIVIPSVK